MTRDGDDDAPTFLCAVEDRSWTGMALLPTLPPAVRFGKQSSPSDTTMPAHPRSEVHTLLTYTSDGTSTISAALSIKLPPMRRRSKISTPYLRRDCAKVLNEWFAANLHRPYPSADEKLELEKISVRLPCPLV